MSNTPKHFTSIEEEIDYILSYDISMTDVAMECDMYWYSEGRDSESPIPLGDI
jgi:hypothetical protein